MIKAREDLDENPRPWDRETVIKALILSYTFEASNTEELLNLPRLRSLFHHWVHGSKILTEGELEKIKDWIRESLEGEEE